MPPLDTNNGFYKLARSSAIAAAIFYAFGDRERNIGKITIGRFKTNVRQLLKGIPLRHAEFEGVFRDLEQLGAGTCEYGTRGKLREFHFSPEYPVTALGAIAGIKLNDIKMPERKEVNSIIGIERRKPVPEQPTQPKPSSLAQSPATTSLVIVMPNGNIRRVDVNSAITEEEIKGLVRILGGQGAGING